MKIGLINPQGLTTTDKRLEDIFHETGNIQGLIDSFKGSLSPGLLLIAALTPVDVETKVIDLNYQLIDYDEEFDLIGITAMTQQANQAYKIADEFRRRGVTVVMGGMHATVMPEDAIKYCDSVFIGEAEDTWPLFLKDFQQGKISKFYKSKKPADLTNSPIPRYDILGNINYKFIWVQTSRGCPHDCEFCASSRVYGHKYRHKSIKQVLDEIHLIIERLPNARINFSDDNLFVDRKFSKTLVGELKKLDIRWFAQTDISIAKDEELIDLIKDAGCTTFLIGFESISQQSLTYLNKNKWKLKQLANYSKSIKKIQSKGIGVIGSFIIGMDGDTVETIDELIDFIINNKIFIPSISVLTPLPGTRVYERLKKEDRLLKKSWENYTFREVCFIPKKMTVEDLQDSIYKIYEKVYNRDVRLEVLKYFKGIFKTVG